MSNPRFTVIPNEEPKKIIEKPLENKKSGRDWTDAQKKAIGISGGKVLVSAAAGSGKTAVLTARVIDRIKSGDDISRFLIVTFTRAAASEMRVRIRKALQDELDNDPDNIHLFKQSLMVSRARICTIDSFCSDIVRKNFQRCGVSSDFRICDNADDEIIRREALDRVFEEKYASNDPGFQRGAAIYGNAKGDKAYFERIYSLIYWLNSLPYPAGQMDYFASMWDPEGKNADMYSSLWFKILYRYARDIVDQSISAYEYALSLMCPGDGMDAYASAMTEELAAIKNTLAQTDPESFIEALCEIVFVGSTVRAKSGTDAVLKTTVQDIRNRAKNDINDLRNFTLATTDEQYLSDMYEFHPVILSIAGMVRDFYKKQYELKSERNCWSFADIEGKALSLLVEDYDVETGRFTPSDIAKEMSDEFDHIMLDEYQDTNLLQDIIFRSVSKNEENIYCVGDIKQSIYRFRRAMPSIFINLAQASDPSGESFPALVNLDKNFRSAKPVIDFVNFFFGSLMTKHAAEIEYDDSQMLSYGSDYSENDYDTKVVLLDNTAIPDDEYGYDDRNDYAQGKACGIEILKLMRSNRTVYDDRLKCRRPLRLSDIAVLMRNEKNRTRGFINALNDLGIAAYSDIATELFDHYEVLFTLAFLETVDNPYKDMSLAAALRSPLFCFDVQELTDLTEKESGTSLYDKLKNSALHNAKSQNALDTIEYYSSKVSQLPVYRLIWQIYGDFKIFDLVTPLGSADIRKENLLKLYRQAEKYENSSLKGLYGFLRYVEKAREQDNSGVQNDAPPGDYVRITTIHKSKGLEYPIVFLCETDRRFNKRDEEVSILMHDTLGIGTLLHDFKNNINYRTMQYEALSIAIRRERIAEEMRLLYVAMTRAREKLYLIVSYKESLEKKLAELIPYVKNYDKAPASFITSASGAKDWILYALMKHPCFADILRENGLPLPVYTADFKIEVEYADLSVQPAPFSDTSAEAAKDGYDDDILTYTYPDFGMNDIPAKVSVSELKGIRQTDEDGAPLFRPDAYAHIPALDNDKITAAQKGTAFHRFMQYIDLNDADIPSQADRLLSRGVLTAAERDSLPIEHLNRFMQSRLADSMRRSKSVNREYRFLWGMPANEYSDIKTDKKLLVQGVIDMFYEDENGEIVLVDYKTDRADSDEYFDRYALQLEYYARAISEITGKTVAKKIIYSVSLDKEIEV